MKNYKKEILFGSGLLVFTVVLIIWYLTVSPQSILVIGIAILTLLLGIFAFFKQATNRKKQLDNIEPLDDEFTKLAKVYAGNQAFNYSLYLWLILFVFNSYFTKNETLLGIGILGSALIYGISLWYFQKTGTFNAQQN